MGERAATEAKQYEYRISDVNIYDLAKKGVLAELQEKLHQVTGMAFVTVDYRGKVVTNASGFTEFCKCRRKYNCYEKGCCLSDAYGGATAAIKNEPYIYICPSGLVDIAVPIVINNQYIGALIGGQVRCGDAQQLDDFRERIDEELDWKRDKEMQEKFNQVPLMSLEKINQIADLAFLYIEQLCERENAALKSNTAERKYVYLQAECKKMQEREKNMENLVLSHQKGQMNPRFILNILNAVSGLAYIEDAAQTGEMVALLTHMLKYQMQADERAISLEEELEHIKCYLQIQKLRFEDKMDYEVVLGEELDTQMLPCGILLPFVENAVNRGVIAKVGKGKIKVLCYIENQDCVISIEDEGVDEPYSKLKKIYEPFRGNYENSWAGTEVYVARQRLMRSYGPKYDVKMNIGKETGTKIVIKIPRPVERNRQYV